jgi:hypothetical protein
MADPNGGSPRRTVEESDPPEDEEPVVHIYDPPRDE